MTDILKVKKGDKLYYYSKHGGKEEITVKKVFTIHAYQGSSFNNMACEDLMVICVKGIPYALEELKIK